MSEIFKPLPKEVYLEWIKTLSEEASEELSSWEMSFISSIEDQLNRGWILSQAQHDKLETIYAEKTL